jgi:hypothetical protein
MPFSGEGLQLFTMALIARKGDTQALKAAIAARLVGSQVPFSAAADAAEVRSKGGSNPFGTSTLAFASPDGAIKLTEPNAIARLMLLQKGAGQRSGPNRARSEPGDVAEQLTALSRGIESLSACLALAPHLSLWHAFSPPAPMRPCNSALSSPQPPPTHGSGAGASVSLHATQWADWEATVLRPATYLQGEALSAALKQLEQAAAGRQGSLDGKAPSLADVRHPSASNALQSASSHLSQPYRLSRLLGEVPSAGT